MLEVRDLTKKFGSLLALKSVSFRVEPGTIVSVIGPNGSGKTTLFNCISRILRIDGGQIIFRAVPLDHLRRCQIAHIGIGRTFQVPGIFGRLSALENVMAPGVEWKMGMKQMRTRAAQLLDEVGLQEKSDSLAEEISGGEQKLLEFARVMMHDPIMFLLDEPFGGVHPVLKERLFQKIQKLQREGKTFLIVSHDLDSVYNLSTKIIVLHNGEIIAEGSKEAIQSNKLVIEAYLGVS